MLPWLASVLVLVALAAAAFYYWQTRLNIPQLLYTPLPPYEIPDVILVGGVIVENRGRQPAPNVKINIQFENQAATMIHHMKVSSDDNAVLRSGGERHSFANISTRALRAHGKIFIYWAAARDVQPHVSVTMYQPSQNSLFSRLLPRKTSI